MPDFFYNFKKLLLVICLIVSGMFSYATTRYVKPGGAGTAPYTSWGTASNDLQAVINQAVAGDEIWIAAGTYKPNRRADALTVVTATDRNDAFVLKSGVKIYGGFAGTETLLSQRNSSSNVVTLSGDIGTAIITTDNCYHVVISAGIVSTATLLDGVTVSGGNANATGLIPNITVNSTSINPRFGGGLFKVNSNTAISSCRFSRNNAILSGAGIYETLSSVSSVYKNCNIVQNTSTGDGGGLYILSSGCLYQNCSFTSNAADNGAGIYLSGSGSPAFTGCTVSSNDATVEGGALYITGTGSPSFEDCIMNSNTATGNGGGISNATTGTLTLTAMKISGNTSGSAGGAVYNNNSPAELTNCLLSGNLAAAGGGIWNSFSNAVIINSTIAGNRASSQGGGIGNGTSNPTMQNCIVYGNTAVPTSTNAFYNSASTPVVEYSLIDVAVTGTGNITGDPLFVSQASAAAAPTITGDYRAQKCSPVLNAGLNADIPTGITTDLNGNARINYLYVDMGAYEMQIVFAVPDAAGIVYVDGTKNGNGSSWGNAVAELSDALVAAKFNSSILQVWVAKGTYFPKYNSGYKPLWCNTVSKNNSFVLTDNIKLYGGFAPGETDTATRDMVLNETILSGDIGTPNIKTDNCNSVIQSLSALNPYINGFTVAKGNNTAANGGGGLKNSASTITISHCVFSENESFNTGGGGIASSSAGTLLINDCSFFSNFGNGQGGGILSFGGAHIKINHCRFSGNTSDNGAGIHVTDASGLSKITNCIFSGNESTNLGGALCSHEQIEISNCLITGNKAVFGGAAHLPVGPCNISNCTIASNLTSSNGSAIFSDGGGTFIRNSIIYGNAGTTLFQGIMPVITNSVVQGAPLYIGAGNINSDPLFISPILASIAPATGGDYHLQKCPASPAIDAGNNTYIPAGITADLDEQSRIVNSKVDMGAYETHYAFQNGGKVYVDKTKTGKGTSWADAAPELADALREAKYNTAINEIWVAKGTYKPLYNAADGSETFCNTGARESAFVLVNNVKVYGGFAGGETTIAGRNFSANLTTLSGDIGIANEITDNCYHVVVGAGAPGTAALDGFTVSKGNANGSGVLTINSQSLNSGNGGGQQNASSSSSIRNCTFSGNSSLGGGAGMYNISSSPSIDNCIFSGNISSSSGGGMFNYQSSPGITSCVFSGNSCVNDGAGIANSTSSPSITNCIISGNTANTYGGGIANSSSSNPVITNTTIAANKSFNIFGGAIHNQLSSAPQIYNCIIWGNSSSSGNIINPATGITIANSIIQAGYAGTGNINVDPLFVSPQSSSAAPTTLGDYRLQPCSPAINWGDNGFVTTTMDLDSNTRIKYTNVDLGAYEVQNIDLANSTWKGVNTNWNDKINWCGGFIPSDTSNVIIPSSLTNYPIIGSGFSNGVKNILLGNGTSVGIINTGSLTINGTYSNNGSAITNNGNWIIAGSAPGQTFPGTAATVNAMNNLEIKNASGISFDRSFSITGSLIPTTGNINVNNNIAVTLKSSATATASVDVIQPTASISYTGTGAFIVERFINTGTNAGAGQHLKSWQFLATPTTGQTIFQSWQENGTAPAGFGTWITGTGIGFDVNTASPSLKYFNQAGINWTAVTNTGTALANKLGYMLFVRGDRTVTTSNGTPNNTVMRSKGQLFSPTNPAPSVPVTANKFQTFGNPYASRIEFNKVLLASTGINDVFYVWDPKLTGTFNLGGYQTITGIAGYVPTVGTPPTGNPATAYYPAGVAAPYIESGQAVFVKGNGTGGNVNFNEGVKVSGSRLVNRPVGNNDINNRQFLFTTLLTNTGEPADGNIIAFERGFGNNINEHDAEKLMNSGENFGLMRDGFVLAVEAHERVVATDTIFYSMSNLRQQGYQLRFAPVNMRTLGLQPFLIDLYLDTKTLLSITDTSYVDFMVTADIASAAANRFFIVFKRVHKLPVAVTDMKYKPNEQNTKAGDKKTIAIHPNPVIGETLQLWFTGIPEGLYTIRLFNSSGQLLLYTRLQCNEGSSHRTIKLPKNMAHGNYHLEVIGAGNTGSVQEFSY